MTISTMSDIKSCYRLIRDLFCRITSRWRVVPDFIIIGAQRSGTTSLWHYLSQHPEIKMSIPKETHYFDLNYHHDLHWYRANFPLAFRLDPGMIVGENSPYYLCHPHVPRRIHESFPGIKLVVLLRNPTARALSHYFHEVELGSETLPVMEAMTSEVERIGDEWLRMLNDETYHSPKHRSYSYKQRGIYVNQLSRYWEYFERDQIHIIQSERFFRETKVVLRNLFQFLGVNENFRVPDISVRNEGVYRQRVSDEVYQYLNSFFKEHNKKLYQAISRNFNW